MSPDEFARLDALEQRIAVAWDEAALALAEIKTAKLYRTTRDGKKQTWDEYCHRIHGYTPQWANKLIKRAKTLQRLKAESGTEVPLSPSAVGHLEGLEPHEQAEVVKAAVKDGQAPKAKDIADKKFEKMMSRAKPGGDMHNDKGRTTKPTGPALYKLTVVTPDKADLEKFGELLPSPITDLKAHSVSGWVSVGEINEALVKVGMTLGTTQPKKVRIVVEL